MVDSIAYCIITVLFTTCYYNYLIKELHRAYNTKWRQKKCMYNFSWEA